MIQFYSITKWANYIAQDIDGKWYAMSNEPSWDNILQRWVNGGTCQEVYPVISSTLKRVNIKVR